MNIPTFTQAILHYGYGLAIAHMAEIGCLPFVEPKKKPTLKEIK
jgi:hypothetical protein